MLRFVGLIRAVIDAEIDRDKLVATRLIRRVALLVAGGVMLLLVGVLVQIAIIVALTIWAGIVLVWSVLIVAGVDLLIGLVLMLMARSNAPRPLEIAARIRRDQAAAELRQTATLVALAGPALRLATASVRGTGRFVFRRNRRRRV